MYYQNGNFPGCFFFPGIQTAASRTPCFLFTLGKWLYRLQYFCCVLCCTGRNLELYASQSKCDGPVELRMVTGMKECRNALAFKSAASNLRLNRVQVPTNGYWGHVLHGSFIVHLT